MELLGLIDVPGWLIFILGILIAGYVYYTWHFNAFEGSGLPGPKPYPVVGSISGMFSMGSLDFQMFLLNTYGRTVKIFNGRKPNIWSSDPEFIKICCIKEFHHLSDPLMFETSDDVWNSMFVNAGGDLWKRNRRLVSPTMSSGKLKNMQDHVNHRSRLLVENVKGLAGKACEIRPLLEAFNMDTIAATAFGLELNTLKDPNNPFIKMGRKIFDLNFSNPIFIISFFFPFLLPVTKALNMRVIPKEASDFFKNVVNQAIEERKKENKKRVDFLQLMLNAHKDEDGDQTAIPDDKGMSEGEVFANSLLFLSAGFDTTVATLLFTCYNLACYPEKQEKLFQEVRKNMEDKDSVDYSTLTDMKYLEHCINESLRLYPPGFVIARTAISDCTVQGIHIKKGWVLFFNIWALHHDPELWDEPEKFIPERFEDPSNIGDNFVPFGLGPRNCIGSRLAMMLVKTCLIQLINSCKLLKTEDTLVPMEFDKMKFMKPIKPIKLGVELRD